jgi:hypothetical protein
VRSVDNIGDFGVSVIDREPRRLDLLLEGGFIEDVRYSQRGSSKASQKETLNVSMAGANASVLSVTAMSFCGSGAMSFSIVEVE